VHDKSPENLSTGILPGDPGPLQSPRDALNAESESQSLPGPQEILSSVPFTLSHAAAAIPFRRTRLVTSALVMGCFAPDFADFVYLKPHGTFGHSLAGIFLLDLPASLLALWLFHAFVKRPFLFFLPSGVRRRLKDGGATAFSFWPLSRLGMVLLSILVGIATHIAWDSLTHDHYWPDRHRSFLSHYVELPITGAMKMDKLLEYTSSVLGLVVLAVWLFHWYRTTQSASSLVEEPVGPAQRRVIIVVLSALTILGATFRACSTVGIPTDVRSIFHFTADFLISAITFFLLGLLICGILLRTRDPQHRRA
jgi:Domain of unknown function (DUF4184)